MFLRKNIIKVCFKAIFFLCYKISSNRETEKQLANKGFKFSMWNFPHGISVALNIRIVFTIKE